MEGSELMKTQARLLNHVFSFVSSMSLKCAVQLDIPDIINNHGKPMTLSKLVEALLLSPTRAEAVHRLMRILVHSGFFTVQKVGEDNEEEGYALTQSSKLLLNNTTSLKPFVLNTLDPVLVSPWHFMNDWFKGSHATVFETVHGMSFWDYLPKHHEFSDNFHEAMASDSRFVMDVVVKESKEVFEDLGSLVDVGGGTGAAARLIAKVFPHLKCTVFDLPSVVANLPNCENMEYVGGNMFESIPSADAILIKNVLHNWGDDDCMKILKRCRESVTSKEKRGKVMIIEVVMDNKDGNNESTAYQYYVDLLMMTTVNGRLRTEKEWEKLFFDSGFTHYKIRYLLGLRSLIEVFA